PSVRFCDLLQFGAGLRERDINDRLAASGTFKKKLQAQSGLAGARAAPDEINAWAGQSAAQYMVEACYACRYALDLQTHIASVLIYINTSCLAGFRGRSPRVRQA